MPDRAAAPGGRPWSGAWTLAVLGAAAAAGCTTFTTAVEEFDSVSGLEGTEQWPDEARYRHDPRRYPWIVRQLDGIGAGWLCRDVLGAEPKPTDVENPSGLARECVEVMIDKGTADLHSSARAARRLLWVAELDESQPLNQVMALRGIERIMAALELDPFTMRLPDPKVTTKEKVDAWVAAFEAGWPSTRGDTAMPPEKREAYLRALEELTALPLVSGAQQRALIGALDKGLELERDATLKGPTREALLRALHHGLSLGLRRGLSSESPRVRETALTSLHRLGGADCVPQLLELIAKPSSAAARGINRYDEDRFVRLTLVRLCGQLDRRRALQTSGNGPAPVEFLYETFFADPDEGLRTVALEALAFCLQRPVDFDSLWVEQWWSDDYVPNRHSTGS